MITSHIFDPVPDGIDPLRCPCSYDTLLTIRQLDPSLDRTSRVENLWVSARERMVRMNDHVLQEGEGRAWRCSACLGNLKGGAFGQRNWRMHPLTVLACGIDVLCPFGIHPDYAYLFHSRFHLS